MSGAFASLSSILGLLAGLLYIFFCVGNFSVNQLVPRHIRIFELSTEGLGSAIIGTGATTAVTRNASAAYGNPGQARGERTSGDGLRSYYTWGFWNRCAGYGSPSGLQYCTKTTWAHRFEPSAALLEDVPVGLRGRATTLLGNESNRIKTDHYLGVWSRIAFYFIFVALCLVALVVIFSLLGARLPGRAAYLNLSAASLVAFICAGVGTVIWTIIIAIFKRQLRDEHANLGLTADYGNALWILWAIDAALFLGIFVNIAGCVVGR